jgi:hypothetical protein
MATRKPARIVIFKTFMDSGKQWAFQVSRILQASESNASASVVRNLWE